MSEKDKDDLEKKKRKEKKTQQVRISRKEWISMKPK